MRIFIKKDQAKRLIKRVFKKILFIYLFSFSVHLAFFLFIAIGYILFG